MLPVMFTGPTRSTTHLLSVKITDSMTSAPDPHQDQGFISSVILRPEIMVITLEAFDLIAHFSLNEK